MLAWDELFQLFLTFPYLSLTFCQLSDPADLLLPSSKVATKLTKVKEKLRKVEKVSPWQAFWVANLVQGPPNACLKLTFLIFLNFSLPFLNFSLTFVNFLATFSLGRTMSAEPESCKDNES